MKVYFIQWKNSLDESKGWQDIDNISFNNMEEISTVGILLQDNKDDIVLTSCVKENKCFNAIRIAKSLIIKQEVLMNTDNDVEIDEIDEDKLIELYPTNSYTNLAKIFNTNTSRIGIAVKKLIDENKIQKREPLVKFNPVNLERYAEEKNVNLDIVKEMLTQNKSYHKIAQKFNVSDGVITYIIRLIKMRQNNGVTINENRFIRLYPSHTINQLANIFKVSRDTILSTITRLDQQGKINRNTKAKITSKKRNFISAIDIKAFCKDYPRFSYPELEEKYNICSSTVSNLVKKLVRDGKLTYKRGPLHN